MSRMAPSVKILEQGASRHKQVRRKVDPQKMHVQKKKRDQRLSSRRCLKGTVGGMSRSKSEARELNTKVFFSVGD